MNTLYHEAVHNQIQYHSEQVGRMKELDNIEPAWSEPRKLFKRKHYKKRFEPFGVPSGTIGVYKIIYDPTGEIASTGCGVIGARLGRHREVFLNKGKVIKTPNSYSGSQAGTLMYQHDTYRKNWSFIWCSIGNKSLSKGFEDLLIRDEKPLFNKECMDGK